MSGMRGEIPSDRMEAIHLGLPYAMTLRDVLPYLVDPLCGGQWPMDKMRARVRLSDGWHMLNQARGALVESEACKLFYEEVEPDPDEARYHCRFYLDDAALRLYSSCEHLLWCVVAYWNLPSNVSKRKEGWSLWVVVKRIALHLTVGLVNVARGRTVGGRSSLLVRVICEAERSRYPKVRGDVARILRRLRSNAAWRECTKYRHDWVHSRLPPIAGLQPAVSFGSFDENDIPPEIRTAMTALGYPAKIKGRKMALGVGPDIEVLRGIVRGAYDELFQAYEKFAQLLAKD
jgi:hypothetical protein